MPDGSPRRDLLQWLFPVAVVILSVLLLQLCFSRRELRAVPVAPENGVLDIRALDPDGAVYEVANDWDFYPGALYTPEDFRLGTAGEKAGAGASASQAACGTYRLRIQAPPGQYLALCSFSLDYATRVFVNGSQVAAFGTVAESAEAFVPQVGYMTIPLYTGESGEVELIYQYANFVHREGGHIPATYLSAPQNIEQFKAGGDLISLTISGGLLLLAIYFLLTAIAGRKTYFLCLVLCCVLMALRDQNFFSIHLLGPDVSWYFAYRALILIVMLMPVSILLLLKALYWRQTRHWPLYLYLALAAAAGVFIVLLPTRELVTVSTAMYWLSIPYLVYLAAGVVRYYLRQRRLGAADILLLIGFSLLLASLAYEALLTGRSAEVTRHGTTVYGMLSFVFLSAASINLRQRQREVELNESRSRSEMLEKMNQLNMDFLHKIAHELKTPLTVISGYAQLTGMQLAGGRISDEAVGNLQTVQQEARRLANMVSRLTEYSYGRKSELQFGPVRPAELLDSVRAIAAPMCGRNHNRIEVAAAACPDIHGNFDMLLQIFINLVVNANKCTQSGTISLRAWQDAEGRRVVFEVEDTGSGIAAEDLSRIFEQGFSTSGGSGLGLTICREAVEAHGGEIWVERTGPAGTVFAFTVPKEADQP